MIVRILGEGQYEVADGELDALNRLDEALTNALDHDDEPTFRLALAGILEHVRGSGTSLPPDALEPSDLILPDGDAHVDDVRELLSDDGLIPG